MSEPEMNDPPDVLATIRRAYRYVVAYERRVLDSITVMDAALRERQFEWVRMKDALYTNFPSRSRPLDRWAWDNIPNYARRFVWRRGEPNSPGTRCVFVDHIADTAFEARLLEAQKAQPNPLRGLPPVEHSRSILRWQIVSFTGSLPAQTYTRVWDDPHRFAQQVGIEIAELRASEPTAEPRSYETPPLTLTTHCVNIAELTDASAVRVQFLEPLLAALAAP